MKSKSHYTIILLAFLLTFDTPIFSQCSAPTESQFIPELHPIRTVRVAFHIIHETSVSDSSNIPDDSVATTW